MEGADEWKVPPTREEQSAGHHVARTRGTQHVFGWVAANLAPTMLLETGLYPDRLGSATFQVSA